MYSAYHQPYAISAGTKGHISHNSSTHKFLLYAFAKLPNPRLEKQIALALKPQTRLHKHLERVALASESIDDVRTGLDERCFEHVAEQAEDRVERRKLGRFVARSGNLTVLDAREEFGEDHEVEDQRRRKERVLYTSKGRKL